MAGTRKFSDIPEISEETLSVLEVLGFATATPVQEATIPLFAGNKDVAVDACTGSGKTLAFVIPVVEKLRRLEEPLKKSQVGAIIISPTRELAKQIHQVAEPFIRSVPGLRSLLMVGGTDPAADVAQFKQQGGHVIVGTPGRIDDVIKRCGGAMDVRALEVLVLDEADRLLDMGFKAQLDAIMARLPKQRRTGLFSATQTEAVEALARAGLRNPIKVAVSVRVAQAVPPPQVADAAAAGGKGRKKAAAADAAAAEAAAAAASSGAADGGAAQVTPSGLSIQYMLCEADEKLSHLAAFLREQQTAAAGGGGTKIIVYFLTCMCVDYYALALKRLPGLQGLNVRALHGKMPQAAREAALAAYAQLPSGVLLCTDLASRGLDIPDVHWIVQFDAPQDPAAFVHRVGRTARMGRSGSALVLLLPHEATYVEFLRLRKVPLTQAQPRDTAAALGLAPSAVCALLRREAETDRELMEKGTRAFVSFVRGYKEHHCRFIFRLPDLDLGRLGSAFGLLRLPRMPEVRKAKGMSAFTPSNVDPDAVKFRDPAREKQRQAVLKKRAAEEKAAAAGGGAPDGRAQKGAGKAGAGKGASAPAPASASAQGDKKLPAAKRRLLQSREDRADLNREYALLKRLKRGQISEHEFDVAIGLSSDSEDGGDGAGGGKVAKGGKPGAARAVLQRGGGAKATVKRVTAGSDDGDDDDDSAGTSSGGDAGNGPRPGSSNGMAGPGTVERRGAPGVLGAEGGVEKKKKKNKKKKKKGAAASFSAAAVPATAAS